MPGDDRLSGDDARRHGRTRPRSRSRSRSPRRQRDETRRRSPLGGEGEDPRRERRRRSPSGRERELAGLSGSSHHRHSYRRQHQRQRDDTRESGRGGGSRKDAAAAAAAVSLPYDARVLSKNDLQAFRPLLAYYLDLQKQRDIRDMDEREVRGRWKSFMGKWNRGELSQGWYDPEMFMSAKERAAEEGVDAPRGDDRRRDDDDNDRGRDVGEEGGQAGERDEDDDDDDEDDLGPSLPPTAREGGQRSGPGIPSMADLSLHRESLAEDAQRDRETRAEELRLQRKDDRKLQRERLDELAPRAEAGTRERMLEKKALVNDKMKEFRERGGPGGGDGQAEVGEQELMGGGDSLAEYKAAKAREQRRKTEREIRREEVARARAAEREERVKEYREREEGVMKGLKELARQRFG